jgi:hypothetical protein
VPVAEEPANDLVVFDQLDSRLLVGLGDAGEGLDRYDEIVDSRAVVVDPAGEQRHYLRREREGMHVH